MRKSSYKKLKPKVLTTHSWSERCIFVNSEEKLKIRKMRLKGETYAKIAEIIGVPANTVKTFCRRNNLQSIEFEGTKFQNICKNCKLKLIDARTNKKFCGDKCRMIWWNKNPDKLCKMAIHTFKCGHCNKTFEIYGKKNRVYCSRKCYFSSRFD